MEPGIIDQITNDMQLLAASYEAPLAKMGLNLLYGLTLIGLSVSFFNLAMQRAPLEAFVENIVRQVLMIGLFVFLIANGGWLAETIIQSFREAASTASSTPVGMSPTSVLRSGLNLAGAILEQGSIVTSMARPIIAIIIVLAFVSIAVAIILALVESFIVIAAASLFLGFGGFFWTRDIALAAARYVFSVGAKLFVLQLLVALANDFVLSFSTATMTTVSDALVCLGAVCVLAALTNRIPNLVQGVINGASPSSFGTFSQSAGIAKTAAVAAIGGGAGGIVASVQAARLQSAQSAASGTPSGNVAMRIGQAAAGTAGNLIKGASGTMVDRLSGRASPHGSVLWQTSANLGDQARQQRNDNLKPVPTPTEDKS